MGYDKKYGLSNPYLLCFKLSVTKAQGQISRVFFCAYSHIACEQGIDNYSAGVKPGSASTPQLGNKLEVKSGRACCHKDWGRPII